MDDSAVEVDKMVSYEQGNQRDSAENIGSQNSTLWMGELDPWADEAFIRQIWSAFGELVNVKLIRDRFTGTSMGYCFVEFIDSEAAQKALQLNGTPIPHTQRMFKLNWASGGGLAERRGIRAPEFSIFVGDLGPETTEEMLLSLFQTRYPSCNSAKIMTDPISSASRGYGFVRFTNMNEQQSALTEMQGAFCGNCPIRISTAAPKKKSQSLNKMRVLQMGMPPIGFYSAPQPMNQFTDPNNTTVFVGGLSSVVTEEELRSFFQGFGEIAYIKIPPGKGCGFVHFLQRSSAEMAIAQMHGYPIGDSRIRLSWGRSQNYSGPAGATYRPAPTPSVQETLGFPPQHAFSPFAPLNPHSVQLQNSQHQSGLKLPQTVSQTAFQDPMKSIPVPELNEIIQSQREARFDRLEAEGSALHPFHYA